MNGGFKESNITKDQLNLLMISYKESVVLNTKLLVKIDSVLDIQRESCQNINKLCDKINDQTSTLVTHTSKLSDKLAEMNISIIREHSRIKNRLYMAFTMLSSIILGLVTTIYKLFVR